MLDPLQCAACAAPVPLVAGEHGICPSCGASYPIPSTYQALRDEASANARKPDALALAKALGKPPPALVQACAMFDSTWFLLGGLGFWIAAGMTSSMLAMPWIGRHLFHINTYDVLAEARAFQLSLLVPLGTLAIGFTLTDWARKRGVVRGGLQSALAATPPTRSGGPKICHRCGSPLAPDLGALTARCAYCQADNLVEMPARWVEGMRAQAKGLVKEVDAASAVWIHERKALRRGLIVRSVAWSVVLVALWFIFGAGAGPSTTYASLAYDHAAGPPTELPVWRDELKSRSVDMFSCTRAAEGYEHRQTCDRGRCVINDLVPLRHGEDVRHQSPNLPDGSVVELQMHDQSFLTDDWATVASAPLSADHPAVTHVPYSGWYRIRITIPGVDHEAPWYCATVKR
jgi:LSD1 subclass zinc finger protein